MADNIYIFENYVISGQVPLITDDGSGLDTLAVSGNYVGTFNQPGAHIILSANLVFNSALSPDYAFIGLINGAGTSEVDFSGSYERAFGGPGNDAIFGSLLGNLLQGDDDDVAGGADRIRGYGGADTLVGMGGGDALSGDDGNDLLFGDADPFAQSGGNISPGNDTLDGDQGNDTLYGGIGTNQLNGGTGFDTADYSGFFDDFGNFSYRITANLDSGTVTVSAKDLFEQTESIVASDSLTGIDVVIGTGGDDWIDGKASFTPDDFAGTTIYGGDGNDRLTGMMGADALYGGAGNDYLTDYGTTLGAPGARSVMSGGTGNDYYNIMGANIDIVELQDGGYDYVWSAITYTLPAFVEHLYLSDIALTRLDGTGNLLNNQLEGTHLANLLSGLGGNDYLLGYAGTDTLSGDGGRDTLIGGDGVDVLYGGKDRDSLSGDGGADRLFGGAGGDVLSGGFGADLLQGGSGADRMRGGGGGDSFVFLAGDAGTGALHDTILDFTSGLDKINLHAIRSGQHFIGAAALQHAGDVRYDSVSGILSGDTNGDGSADYEIWLGAGRALTGTDLTL